MVEKGTRFGEPPVVVRRRTTQGRELNSKGVILGSPQDAIVVMQLVCARFSRVDRPHRASRPHDLGIRPVPHLTRPRFLSQINFLVVIVCSAKPVLVYLIKTYLYELFPQTNN